MGIQSGVSNRTYILGNSNIQSGDSSGNWISRVLQGFGKEKEIYTPQLSGFVPAEARQLVDITIQPTCSKELEKIQRRKLTLWPLK